MKITNRLNLPDMLVRAAQKEYTYQDKRYSITSMFESDRALMLKRRHNDEIEQDIAESIWMLWGSVVHYALETGIECRENEYVEEHLEHTFENGYTLSGIIDHVEDFVDDYKTTSVWTVIFGSNNEHWKKQLQMGAYLHYKEHGNWINKGRIIAILKDWNKRDVKDNYPKLPVEVIEFDLGTPEEIEKWILDRFKRIEELEKMPDLDLPLCTDEERFNSGTKWAVKKKTYKKAFKVFDDFDKARDLLITLEQKYPGEYELIERPGEDKKCQNYCSVCKFCPYYMEHYDNEFKMMMEDVANDLLL